MTTFTSIVKAKRMEPVIWLRDPQPHHIHPRSKRNG
jgi:hypothetical protein